MSPNIIEQVYSCCTLYISQGGGGSSWSVIMHCSMIGGCIRPKSYKLFRWERKFRSIFSFFSNSRCFSTNRQQAAGICFSAISLHGEGMISPEGLVSNKIERVKACLILYQSIFILLILQRFQQEVSLAIQHWTLNTCTQ